jgi:ABC-type lipoprotein export system ATPase subunit
MASMISLEDITKTYHLESLDIPVLKRVNLSIEEGEYVAIMGASGSGKSTLMNIIGCLDRPTSGQYFLMNLPISAISILDLYFNSSTYYQSSHLWQM